MLKTYLKVAIRHLSNNKIFTSLNVLGLSIGMAAALLILIWVQNELTFDSYHKNADQIYRIISQWHGKDAMINIDAIPLAVKELAETEVPGIEELFVARPAFGSPLVEVDKTKVLEENEMVYISDNWLQEFSYQVLAGSIQQFNDNKYSMALTRSRARKYFGDTDPLGQTVRINEVDYTIRLILADNPANSSFQFKVFLPLSAVWEDRAAYERDYQSANYNYLSFFKCPGGVAPQDIVDQLSDILVRVDNDEDKKTCLVLPLKDMRFYTDISNDYFTHQNKAAVYIFGLISLVILLTAGWNYINLSTAMLSKKVKEIAIKKVVGADFRHIFTQALLETGVVVMLAFIIAIGLVASALPKLSLFIGYELPLKLEDPYILLVLGSVFVLGLLVAGIYPAVLFAGFKPIGLIQNESIRENRDWLRKSLVIAQFVAVFVVMISTGVIYQQLQYIQKKDVGYDRSHVINLQPNLFRVDSIARNLERFALYSEALRTIPEIESVALAENAISNITNRNRGSFSWDGKPADMSVIVHQITANEDLISVFDLEMTAGRWFSGDLETDQINYIINETAAKNFNIPEPVVGRKATFHNGPGQIIGVVKDFHFASMRESIEPLVISHNSNRGRSILARVNGENATVALKKAEEIFNSFLPGIPFQYHFLDESFQKMHENEAKMSLLFLVFAGLLVFISCLGLLGLAIFAAENRVKEIGIRKVLGASVGSIIGLLSKDFLKLVFIAFVFAAPITWYAMQQWLKNFAYRIELPWWIFVLAGIIVTGITIIVIGFQSVKAALANPVDSLKTE